MADALKARDGKDVEQAVGWALAEGKALEVIGRGSKRALGRHWQFLPVFYGVAFALTFVDAYLSVVMYILLLLYYALPGPAVIRLMTARRAHRKATSVPALKS